MSKSRGEKGNKTPSINQNNQPTHQNAIIPGKFLESDWIDLVENESCEEFIVDIVNDTVSVACDLIFRNIIEQRVQPYSIFCAKELIVDLLELQFLQCDAGEGDISKDESWLEDDEPSACITDSWAQGAVPVLNKTTTKTTADSTPVTETVDTSRTEEEGSQQETLSSLTDVRHSVTDVRYEKGNDEELTSLLSPSLNGDDSSFDVSKESYEGEEKKDGNEEVEIEKSSVNLVPTPPSTNKVSLEKSNILRRKGYKPHTGSLPNFSGITLTPVTDDCPKLGRVNSPDQHSAPFYSSEAFLKNQHGRPPGIKDVLYDKNGNVMQVQKINAASLPKHRIRTKFSIIDPVKEANQKARLMKTHMKKNITSSHTGMKQHRNLEDAPIINTSSLLKRFYAQGATTDKLNGLRTSLPPPMVDIVDVAAGVVIREGVLSKQGPVHKKMNETVSGIENPLQPVPGGEGRKLEIQDIIANASPTINNCFPHSKPLPAILM